MGDSATTTILRPPAISPAPEDVAEYWRELHPVLRKLGLLIPLTPEDIKSVKAVLDEDGVDVPPELCGWSWDRYVREMGKSLHGKAPGPIGERSEESYSWAELPDELDLRVLDCCSGGPECRRRIFYRLAKDFGIEAKYDKVCQTVDKLKSRGWILEAVSDYGEGQDRLRRRCYTLTSEGAADRFLYSEWLPLAPCSLIADESIDPNIGS